MENFSRHISILKIKSKFSSMQTFKFNNASQEEVKKVTLDLSSNKSTLNDIFKKKTMKYTSLH